MTIATTSSNQSFAADGVLDTFSFTFKVIVSSDVDVYLDGVLQGSGYTTTPNADQEASPGGDVVFDSPPANGVTVNLVRNAPFSQTTDYTPYTAFPADSHESALDKLTMLCQQLEEKVGRAFIQDVTASSAINIETPSVSDTQIPYYDATYSGLKSSSDMVYDEDATTGEQFKLRAAASLTSGPAMLVRKSSEITQVGPLVKLDNVFNNANQAGYGLLEIVTNNYNGDGLLITHNPNTSGGDAIKINMSATSSLTSGTALVVDLTTANAMDASTEAVLLKNSTSTTFGGSMLLVDVDVGSVYAGIRVDIDAATNSTAGIRLNQDNTGGNALSIYSNTASRTAALVAITNDNFTGTGKVLTVKQDQGGDAVTIDHLGANAGVYALNVTAQDDLVGVARFYSLANGRSVPVVSIIQDQATGAAGGHALFVEQNGAGAAIAVTGFISIGGVQQPKVQVIDIGDWDMDTDGAKLITHGLDIADIRDVTVTIRNDAGTAIYPLHYDNTGTGVEGYFLMNNVQFQLGRIASGFFDGTNFNATSYNRGWITVTYV